MALPNSPGSPGAGEPNPGVIDLGTIFVDSDIIFGFTSHLLKRKTKVRVETVEAHVASGMSSYSSITVAPHERENQGRAWFYWGHAYGSAGRWFCWPLVLMSSDPVLQQHHRELNFNCHFFFLYHIFHPVYRMFYFVLI